MQVIGTIELHDEPKQVGAMRYTPAGAPAQVDDAVQRESLLDVYVNDILTMRLGCSASALVDLVIGRLFTEGLIVSAEEIEAVSICEHAMRADVVLANRKADLSRKATEVVPTCCTQNRVLNDYFGVGGPLVALPHFDWSTQDVFAMATEFAADRTAHARTKGCHSAFLWQAGKLLTMREDIGRHNAFDKAVGWALLHGVNLSTCELYTSGRVPTDMVTKAIRARIPLLVSKSVATDKTVEIAREYNLSLVCQAKPESFDVMSGKPQAKAIAKIA